MTKIKASGQVAHRDGRNAMRRWTKVCGPSGWVIGKLIELAFNYGGFVGVVSRFMWNRSVGSVHPLWHREEQITGGNATRGGNVVNWVVLASYVISVKRLTDRRNRVLGLGYSWHCISCVSCITVTSISFVWAEKPPGCHGHDHTELAPYWARRDDAMLSRSSHHRALRLHGAVIIYDRHCSNSDFSLIPEYCI